MQEDGCAAGKKLPRHLQADAAFLASRVAGKPHRPLLHGPASAREVLDRMQATRGPLYEEVADITVSVEPFHAQEDKPKRALAQRIAELVLAHEAKVAS